MKKPVKVILWGTLGEKVVPEMTFYVATLREVILGLDANFPNFTPTILSLQGEGYAYQVIVSDNSTGVDLELDGSNPNCYSDFLVEGKTVTISPVVAGSNLGKLFMGVALIGLGILTGGVGFILGGILMGVQSLLSGHPEKPKEGDPDSLVISGQTNTTVEGTRIPIVVGKYLVGDQILSASYQTEYKALY